MQSWAHKCPIAVEAVLAHDSLSAFDIVFRALCRRLGPDRSNYTMLADLQ